MQRERESERVEVEEEREERRQEGREERGGREETKKNRTNRTEQRRDRKKEGKREKKKNLTRGVLGVGSGLVLMKGSCPSPEKCPVCPLTRLFLYSKVCPDSTPLFYGGLLCSMFYSAVFFTLCSGPSVQCSPGCPALHLSEECRHSRSTPESAAVM